MKSNLLNDAIGLIDDDIIEEQYAKGRYAKGRYAKGRYVEGRYVEARYVKNKKRKVIIFVSSIAVLVAAVAIMIILPKVNDTIAPKSTKEDYQEKHVLKQTIEEAPIEWTADTWNMNPDAANYREANISGTQYVTCLVATSPEYVGEEIGVANMVGQDLFSLEIHEMTAKVYAIKGIAPKCAVAIKFHDKDEYAYSYMNANYEPKTLGDMLTDLDFMNSVSTGIVYAEKDSDIIAFEGLSQEKVRELLFDDTSLVNEPGKNVGTTEMSVSLTAKIFGIDSVPKTLALTEDGYMWTNLLESGKYFYIGKEKIEAFKNYVEEHCDGYKYIYDELDGDWSENPE